MSLIELWKHLWLAYTKITPQAETIRSLFEEEYGPVINDHIAFRTFAGTSIDLDTFSSIIEDLGYTRFDQEYLFPEKKLRAYSFNHSDSKQPKLFVSELLHKELPDKAQSILKPVLDAIGNRKWGSDLFSQGLLWPAIKYEDYLELAAESEYAAWLCAIGIYPNHFTVSVDSLPGEISIEAVVQFLTVNGFALNEAGGVIKGSAKALLEQCSTIADTQAIHFADGQHVIPTCYYEFARRYPDSNGKLFAGFVPNSADKIFESTDRRLK